MRFDQSLSQNESQTSAEQTEPRNTLDHLPNEQNTALLSYQEQFWQLLQTIGFVKDPNERHVSRLEKLLLPGRVLGTATDFAEEILFLMRNILSAPLYLLGAVVTTIVGLAMSGSDGRNAINNLRDFRQTNLNTSWKPYVARCSSTVFGCCSRDNDADNSDSYLRYSDNDESKSPVPRNLVNFANGSGSSH